MHDNGMSKSDIAKAEGISNAKVSRAFQAAAVPGDIIEMFPVVSELTLQDYQLLLDVSEEAKAEAVDISGVIAQIQKNIEDAGELNGDINADDKKAQILSYFRAAKRQLKNSSPAKKSLPRSWQASLIVMLMQDVKSMMTNVWCNMNSVVCLKMLRIKLIKLSKIFSLV